MRVVRVPLANLQSGEHELGDESAHYVMRVVRLRAGDAFVAFDPGRGVEADASVVREDGRTVTVRVGALRPGQVVATRPIVWLQGIAKSDKLDAIVRDATELGVTRIVPCVSRFSVVKLDAHKAEDKRARWERIAQQAARQCGRADVPIVDAPCDLADALAAVDVTHRRFFLYERADVPLGPPLRASLDADEALAFAVGPEGGFAEDEVELARSTGWHIASLGDTVLRTETVAAAVLGAVRIWTTS